MCVCVCARARACVFVCVCKCMCTTDRARIVNSTDVPSSPCTFSTTCSEVGVCER